MKAYVHTKSETRQPGVYSCYLTVSVDVKLSPMPHHERGLSWTASGYGARIPTEYMVKYNGRWHRVYCIVYSNCGTLYIGRKYSPCLTVQIEKD